MLIYEAISHDNLLWFYHTFLTFKRLDFYGEFSINLANVLNTLELPFNLKAFSVFASHSFVFTCHEDFPLEKII
jgi:hypothetical protein